MYVCSLQCGRTALPSTGVKINQSINQSINDVAEDLETRLEMIPMPMVRIASKCC